MASGIDSFAPELGLDSDSRTYTYNLGSSLTVIGDDAQLLIDTFFSDCEGQTRQLDCKVYKECCDQWFDYVITYEGLTYCIEDCSVTVTPRRITEATRCYNYLNSTIYWKNGFIDAYDHPQVWYCNQPGFIQKALMIIAPIIVAILSVIDAILSVIDSICDGIASIFGGDCDIDLPEQLKPCNFINYLTGCGRKVPSPLLREIFEFHCNQCGLVFKSSVFQDTIYKNTVLFQLQYNRGRFNDVNWINSNGANLTVIQILDNLSFMNLDYRIINGQLVVERKDYFDTIRDNIGSVRGLDYCVTFKDDNACAYGRYSYTDDALDHEGNKLIEYTDDIIEFNAENADWKNGECTVTAPFGRARFMFDAITGSDREPLFSDYEIDGLRSGNLLVAVQSDLVSLLTQYVAANCGPSTHRTQDLIIHNDQASQLKLLVLEEGFDRDDAKTIRKAISGVSFPYPGTFYWYNYPMSFREFEPDGSTEFTDGLYSNFQAIDNPNNTNRSIYEIASLQMPVDCQTIASILASGAGLEITTPYGPGYPESTTIDFDAGVVTHSNVEIKCE